MHSATAWGQWALELLLRSAILPQGTGKCNSCRTALGQRAMGLPQHTAVLPGGTGMWNQCNATPHCPWVLGS